MADILLHFDNHIFSYRVAGILIINGKVLLQAPKNQDQYAFPGGHVAFGETNAETLIREWREEIGVDIDVSELKWIEESIFLWGGKNVHQIYLSYIVELKDVIASGSYTNDGARLAWLPIDKLNEYELYPGMLKNGLRKLPEHPMHVITRG